MVSIATLSHSKSSARLCLKGAGEEAVLCSAAKTFAVKTVETSSLVRLVPRNACEATR
jgi:hypothetical protein